MKTHIIALFAATLALISARAEFFIDLYGGVASVQDGWYTASSGSQLAGSGGYPGSYSDEAMDLSGGSSAVVGARLGYWFDWFGLALDISNFSTEAGEGEVSFSSFSPMVLARYPLMVSEEFPHGRLYPYIGAGVSMVFADVEDPWVSSPESSAMDEDSGNGYFLCVGGKWFFSKRFGAFVEYRYVSQSFEQSYEGQTGSLLWPRYDTYYYAEGEAQAHQFVAGVTWQFGK